MENIYYEKMKITKKELTKIIKEEIEKQNEFSHGGRIPLSKIKEKASQIHSDYVINGIKSIISRFSERGLNDLENMFGGPKEDEYSHLGKYANAFRKTFKGWSDQDMKTLYNLIKK